VRFATRFLVGPERRFPFHTSSAKKLTLNQTPVVTVNGKAFFDVGHSLKDQKSNRRSHLPGYAAWEIHPVMALHVCGMLPPMPSQIGRQKLPVDREKVRMLVGEIGYTEAAKRSGIARNTLYQWNYRYKWSILPADSRSVRNVTALSPSVPSVAGVTH
jgi:hypothetical protein